MPQPARLFDTAPGSRAIRYDDATECRRKSKEKGSAETEQKAGVGKARQEREAVEQGKDGKDAEHPDRRPASGPDPLPEERGARKAKPVPERRIGWWAVGHRAPRFRAGSSAISLSQAGTLSNDSSAS